MRMEKRNLLTEFVAWGRRKEKKYSKRLSKNLLHEDGEKERTILSKNLLHEDGEKERTIIKSCMRTGKGKVA